MPTLAAASPADALGKLSYEVEWRLIRAGNVVIEPSDSESRIKIDSAGLVSTLFKINNIYTVHYAPSFCTTDSLLDSKEGKRHRQTSVTYDRSQNRAIFVERDLLKNEILRSTQTDIPNCVHDALGGMLVMRGLALEPGQYTQIPTSDGRRVAQVKIEAQEREEVTTPAGKFNTMRYEANLMNGVVYQRKGRVFVWLTDDANRTPVKIVLRLSFPVGTVTLQLQKEEPK